MDDKDLTLHTTPDGSGVFRDIDGQTHCTIRPYNHVDLDMALARQSGQELVNHYVITNSPAAAHIRRFFHASIRHLTAIYHRIAAEQAFNDIKPSVCDQMRRDLSDMAMVKQEFDPSIEDGVVRRSPVVFTARRSSTRVQSRESPVVDPPRRSSTMETDTDSPVVDTPRRSSNANNHSLAVMEASRMETPRYCLPTARGSVSFTSIASLDLQTFIDPLPLERAQIMAVAGRDITIARRNLAEITRYIDIHAAHLANCSGGSDDSIPLMSAETFPRLPGGIGTALQEVQNDWTIWLVFSDQAERVGFDGPLFLYAILWPGRWFKLKIVHSVSFNVMSTILSLPLKRVNP